MKPKILLMVVLLLVIAVGGGCGGKKKKKRSRGKKSKVSTKWLQGADLKNSTPAQWRAASAADKLATCGRIVRKLKSENKFVPGIQKKMKYINVQKDYATQLVGHLDIVTDPARNRKLNPGQTISSMIPHEVMMLGWTQ